MTEEELRHYVNYLAERVREADFEKRVRDAVLQDFLDRQKAYDESLSEMKAALSDLDSLKEELRKKDLMLKSADRKIADLTARLKFADKERFGDRRYGARKERPEGEVGQGSESGR